jgi:hypothetical protein
MKACNVRTQFNLTERGVKTCASAVRSNSSRENVTTWNCKYDVGFVVAVAATAAAVLMGYRIIKL